MSDSVNHPSHYNQHPSGVECLQIVRHMNFNLGNVIKYIWRHGVKPEADVLDDLRKARFYLDDEIKRLEEQVTRNLAHRDQIVENWTEIKRRLNQARLKVVYNPPWDAWEQARWWAVDETGAAFFYENEPIQDETFWRSSRGDFMRDRNYTGEFKAMPWHTTLMSKEDSIEYAPPT